MAIKDPYGRPVNNLRVSITQRCALNCFFCHREGEDYQGTAEMAPEEIERIVRIAASFGVEQVKLTGGEPLLRPDILAIVQRLSAIPSIREVALTTNGVLLNRLAKPLKASGLRRVNVSLPSLEPRIYRAITGTDFMGEVVAGIREAADAGLSPIKVNMVVLKGLNEDQVWDMVGFTKENSLILQLIEFESPNPESEAYRKHHMDMAGIEAELEGRAERVMIRDMQKRRKYFLDGGGEVEVVRPMHNTGFCAHCHKLRVTSDGKFKPCLFRSDNLIDFLTPLRRGASDEALKILFLKAVDCRRPYFT